MSMQSLLSAEIQEFIREHENADVAALALKKPPDTTWDYPAILNQIKSRQKAKKKCPQWLEVKNVLFPPPDIIEQASSAATARYKAGLVKGTGFADLTGGAGVDTLAMAQNFKSGFCIEQDQTAAEMLAHNLPLLTRTPLKVQHKNAEDFIADMPDVDCVMIDPQRRDNSRKGKFKLAECSPDITAMLPVLLQKSAHIIIKTSPMLDITETIKTLGHVTQVHVMEMNGECKELLFVLSQNKTDKDETVITALQLDETGHVLTELNFTQNEEQGAQPEYGMPEKYLYEPGPAFQKAGGFGVLAKRFNLKKLHKHTHLYTSAVQHKHFPGRAFEIIAQYPVKAGKIPLKQANLTTRNFPLSVADLRKKLGIAEGGEDYLFACTLENGTKTVLHGRKT